MHELLHQKAGHYNFYHARKLAYAKNDTLPFRISPAPFYVTAEETVNIHEIGELTVRYFHACDVLYHENNEVKKLLDKNKPEFFQNQGSEPQYLFLRPDLLYTDQGFKVCEIETSPFGLGLAALLNEGYTEGSFETLVDPVVLAAYCHAILPQSGEILYSEKTKAYSEQLAYLGDTVFSHKRGEWVTKQIDPVVKGENIYRAFYLHEYQTDPQVKKLLNEHGDGNGKSKMILPSLTPQMEEKVLLALIWDKRYVDFFQKNLGDVVVKKLQHIIPPTIIVGQESSFIGTMPVENLLDLATIPRSKRKYVLKVSGFDPDSSWAEGVALLHEASAEKTKKLLEHAINDTNQTYILQEFVEPKKVTMSYEDPAGLETMRAGMRITPYFNAKDGTLISIKATGCENTNYIHGTSTSINTAVAEKNMNE